MTRAAPSRWLVVVACLAMLPYVAGLDLTFQSDDYIVIAHFAEPGQWLDRVLDELTGPQYGVKSPLFFRPIASTTIALDQAVWGTNAFGFHLTNMLAHGLNAGLVLLIAWTLFRRRTAAVVAALLFAWFSTHPDAVIWTVGRVDGLATGFSLLAILCHLRARRTSSRTARILSWIAFALALGCKESAVTIVGVLAAVELLGLARGRAEPWLHRLRPVLPALFVTLVYLIVRQQALGTWTGGYAGLPGIERWPALAWQGLIDLIWLAVPISSAEAAGIPGGEPIAWLAAILVWTLLIRFLFLSRRSDPIALPAFLFGLLWYAATASVLMGLLVREAQGVNLRLWYLPSIGLAWAVAPLIAPDRLAEERRLRWLLGAALLLVHGLLLGTRIAGFRGAAGRAAEIREAVLPLARSSSETEPVLIAGIPNQHRGAFVFAWGLWAAFRQPFCEVRGQVFPIKGGAIVEPELSFLPFDRQGLFRWQPAASAALPLRAGGAAEPSEDRFHSVSGHESEWQVDVPIEEAGRLEVHFQVGATWNRARLHLELELTGGGGRWTEFRFIPLPGRIDWLRIPVAYGSAAPPSEIHLKKVTARIVEGPKASSLRELRIGGRLPRIEVQLPSSGGSSHALMKRSDLERPLSWSPDIPHRALRVTTYTALSTAVTVLPTGQVDLMAFGTARPLGSQNPIALLPPAFGLGERWIYVHLQLLEDPENPYSVVASSQLMAIELDPSLEPVIDALVDQLSRQTK